jgi:hypothetical protein
MDNNPDMAREIDEICFDRTTTRELIKVLGDRLSEQLGVKPDGRFRVEKIKLRLGTPWGPPKYRTIRALVSPGRLFAVHWRLFDPEDGGVYTDCVDVTHVPSGLRLTELSPFECWTNFPKMLAWTKALNFEVQASDRLELLLRQKLRFVRRGLWLAQSRMLRKKVQDGPLT